VKLPDVPRPIRRRGEKTLAGRTSREQSLDLGQNLAGCQQGNSKILRRRLAIVGQPTVLQSTVVQCSAPPRNSRLEEVLIPQQRGSAQPEACTCSPVYRKPP